MTEDVKKYLQEALQSMINKDSPQAREGDESKDLCLL